MSTSVNCQWVYTCRIICFLRWIYHKDYCWILSCRWCNIKCSIVVIYNVRCWWHSCNNRNIILCFFNKVCKQFFCINCNSINIERHRYIIVMYQRIKYRSHATLINCKIIKFGDCIVRSYNIYNIVYCCLRCLNTCITVTLYKINFWCKNYIKVICTMFQFCNTKVIISHICFFSIWKFFSAACNRHIVDCHIHICCFIEIRNHINFFCIFINNNCVRVLITSEFRNYR